ncbi:MAG: ECF transporter S component [Candidatus Hodarchaeota archaeon]
MSENTSEADGNISRIQILRITIVALYTAATVAAAYILILIPNVEIYTMLVFLGGLLFGKYAGTSIGFISTIIYRLFNIYGASDPALLIIQLISYSILGFLGGVLKKTHLRQDINSKSQLIFGLIGACFIAAYLLTADIIGALIFCKPGTLSICVTAKLVSGILFYAIGVIANLVTFSVLMPLIIVSFDKQLVKVFPRDVL